MPSQSGLRMWEICGLMVGVFLSFRFCGCPIVAVAAKPGGPEAPESENPLGVSELIEVPAEELNAVKCA